MKKLIAMILALTMVFGLVACGNKTVEPDPTPAAPTQPVDQGEVTDPTQGTETPEPTDPVVEPIDDKQALWEKVFTEGTFKMSATSFELKMGDAMTITLLTDKDGKAYMAISGTVEGEGTMGSALYKQDENTAYFHQFGEAEGEAVDQWYLCEITTNEEGTAIDGMMSENETTQDLVTALETVENIVYVETIDGIDYVDIFYTPVDEFEDEETEWETTYDASFEFEYEGAVGQFRYTEQSTAEGWTSSSCMSEKDVDGIEIFDWDFDRETMTLTCEDEPEKVLQCTLVTDHLNNPVEVEPTAIRVAIDPETYEIKGMTVTEDGAIMELKCIECDNVADFVELPENIEATMAAEDAVSSLAMIMFVLAMAQADMG